MSAPDAAARNEAPQVLTGASLFLAGAFLALSNFIVILDTTIANVSLPSIAGGLAVSPTEAAWVVTSYAAAEAIMVPLTGFLATRFGAVRVFIVALVLFGFFSALCGLAWSLPSLVLFRVLQGLAGGPIIPLSQTLLNSIFPPHLRGQALGLWSMTLLIAPICGPILGGIICDTIGWRWIFYINVPIIAAAIAGIIFTLRALSTPGRAMRMDVVGLALLVIWVGALQIAVDKGRELDWLSSPLIVTLTSIGVVGFVAFLIWELTEREPIVDLRVFRYRSFSIGLSVLSVTFATYFSSVVILPLWMQTNLNYTPTWAGYATAFNGLLAVAAAPLVGGFFLRRFDPRLLASVALLIMGAAMWMRTYFPPDVPFSGLILPALLQGLAMPFYFVPMTQIVISDLKPHEMAGGAGLMSFARTGMAAFAASLATTAWTNEAARARAEFATHITPFDPAVGEALSRLRASGLSEDASLHALEQMVQAQAVMAATTHFFSLSMVFFFVSAAAIWLIGPVTLALQAQRPSAAH